MRLLQIILQKKNYEIFGVMSDIPYKKNQEEMNRADEVAIPLTLT
jgi:hypothetical protein